MLEIKMRFYVTIKEDGTYSVQNAVMGRFGQQHEHTKEEFEEWRKGIPDEDIIFL